MAITTVGSRLSIASIIQAVEVIVLLEYFDSNCYVLLKYFIEETRVHATPICTGVAHEQQSTNFGPSMIFYPNKTKFAEEVPSYEGRLYIQKLK